MSSLVPFLSPSLPSFHHFLSLIVKTTLPPYCFSFQSSSIVNARQKTWAWQHLSLKFYLYTHLIASYAQNMSLINQFSAHIGKIISKTLHTKQDFHFAFLKEIVGRYKGAAHPVDGDANGDRLTSPKQFSYPSPATYLFFPSHRFPPPQKPSWKLTC